MRPIYFDNAATSQLDPRVAEGMAPWLLGQFGNPSSLHLFGRQARTAVDQARRQVAELIGATPEEIVFTASGTEANNMALFGILGQEPLVTGHAVTSAIEHPAILRTLAALERRGLQVTRVDPNSEGILAPEAIEAALRPDTRLVSVMAANNVIGTIQPIARIAALVRARGILFHTDAVQAAGKIPLNVEALGVDLLSLSAHKFHGPQGVGALYVRRGVTLDPLIWGGGQERGLRSATENVAGLVGVGRAAEIARTALGPETARLVGLRERLIDGVLETVPGAQLVGHPHQRLPGHACFVLAGLTGDAIRLLLELDQQEIAVASGSACSSNHAAEPSHVLLALGFDAVTARGSLRISLGRFNTAEELDRFLAVFPRTVKALRPVASFPRR